MNQSTNKILIAAVVILLITNIALLSLFLLNRPEGRKTERKSALSNYLKNDIGFTNAQMVELDTIKNQHRREVKQMFDVMKNLKEENFRHIGQEGFSDSAIGVAATFSANQQKQLELLMLNHLKTIRNICTPQQRAKFDTGFYRVMQRPRSGDDKPRND